jgi:transposase
MGKRVEEVRGSVRLRKPERRQLELSVRCVDDLVGADHPVRMVAGVVETLDLSRFYEPIQAREGVKGRDATSPELLVCLWLYGCIRGIGSARELERRCQESAAFQWLCGGVSVNYHLLSDFRTGHGAALDELFTQIIASLVERELVTVGRVSQDGVRVRIGAGASSFRRKERLEKLLGEAKQHVQQLRQQMKDPAQAAAVSLRRQGARKRAARERQQRLQQAIAQLPELQAKQAAAVQRAGNGKEGEKKRKKQLRVSTTDPQARVMKMANGGFNPAVNIQLATDTKSRAVLGVAVSNEGQTPAASVSRCGDR